MNTSEFWNTISRDFYFYALMAFIMLVAFEELLARHRHWQNRDDQIAFGQREDSPANRRAGH